MNALRSKRSRGILICGFLLLIVLVAAAAPPQWWLDRGAIVPNSTANDYAPINQGQLKRFAKAAGAELDSHLPGGAGEAVHTLIASWSVPNSDTNDYAAVNLGQLKKVAKLFYDRLIAVGYTNTYPWSNPPAPSNDYAIANIGQVKQIFSFDFISTDLAHDADQNGLSDWWEKYYFGHLGVDPNAVAARGDGLTNLQAFQRNVGPLDYYDGKSPMLTLVSGNKQEGPPGAFLPLPFIVKVADTAARPLANAPVTFTVGNVGGLLAATPGDTPSAVLQTRTGADGIATACYLQPATAGIISRAIASVTTGSSRAEVPFTATTLAEGLPATLTVAPSEIDEIVNAGQTITRNILVTNNSNATHLFTAQLKISNTADISYSDSDQPGGPQFVWNDISVTGTHMNSVSDADDDFEAVNISFPFPYFGDSYSKLYVGSNGFVTLGSGSTSYDSQAPPSASAPANLIAAFHNDLDLRASGDVYYQDNGDSVVIQFTNAARYAGDALATFQIVLKRDGAILFYFKEMTGTLDQATVGIQNSTKDSGLTIAWKQPYLKSNLAISIAVSVERFTNTVENIVWSDSDQVGGPQFVWEDISVAGTHLNSVSNDDDGFEGFNISFLFPYFGNAFETVYVSSNGYVSLGTPSAAHGTYSFPDPWAPSNDIAAFQNDLNLAASGDVYYLDYGDRVVIQFNNAARHAGDGVATFQIVLRRDGTILFYYKEMTGNVNAASVGIQNATRDKGVTIANQQPYLKSGLAVRITDTSEWLHLSPDGGSLTPGQSTNLELTLNAQDFQTGVFHGRLRISSEDPAEQAVLVPITMAVREPPKVAITSPAEAAQFISGTDVLIEADASDDRGVARVDFYDGKTMLGTVENSPYQFPFRNLNTGTHLIAARATNIAGSIGISKTVHIQAQNDTDGNGLGDDWELLYFGSLNQSAVADPDQDGFTNLQEFQRGTDPMLYYNGQRPSVELVNGNQQQGTVDTTFAAPLTVRVLDATGHPLVNAPVTFSISEGAGQISITNDGTAPKSTTLTVRTDAQGNAQVYYYSSTSTGAYKVTASAGDGATLGQTLFTGRTTQTRYAIIDLGTQTQTADRIANNGMVLLKGMRQDARWNQGQIEPLSFRAADMNDSGTVADKVMNLQPVEYKILVDSPQRWIWGRLGDSDADLGSIYTEYVVTDRDANGVYGSALIAEKRHGFYSLGTAYTIDSKGEVFGEGVPPTGYGAQNAWEDGYTSSWAIAYDGMTEGGQLGTVSWNSSRAGFDGEERVITKARGNHTIGYKRWNFRIARHQAYSQAFSSEVDCRAVSFAPISLNSAGVVLGRDFLYANGTQRPLQIYDPSGGAKGWPYLSALNDHQITKIDTSGNPTSIESPQIVGYFWSYDSARFSASIWEENADTGQYLQQDLNDLIPQNGGWTLRGAIDINDNGAIVGWGDYQPTAPPGQPTGPVKYGEAVLLLPFELNSDLNNDGKAGEGTDSSLKTAGIEDTASDDAKEKATEYLFVNDQLSNGLWDKEDSDTNKPTTENNDDDLTELKTICAATWGAIWFEYEGGDIAKLAFYKAKECTPANKVSFPFALSETNKLPEKLYVRAEGDWTAQVEGKLLMKFGKADKSETYATDKLRFTVVKHIGDKKFFHAVRDYILENNTRVCVREKTYDSEGYRYRFVAMREEGTVMYPIDAARRPSGTPLKGIDAVVGAYPDISVVINGNQCFFTDDYFNTFVGKIEAAARGLITDKCHGRVVRFGALDTAVSSDNFDMTTSPAGSPLAGPEPLPDGSRGGNYIAQYDQQKKFVLAAGRVSLGGAPDQPAGNPDAAVGGLSAYYARPDRIDKEQQLIGYWPGTENGKGILFTATQAGGSGGGPQVKADAEKSGVLTLPGGRQGEIQLLILDGESSVGLAHVKPDGQLRSVIKRAKHTGSGYYINVYFLFRCQPPRTGNP